MTTGATIQPDVTREKQEGTGPLQMREQMLDQFDSRVIEERNRESMEAGGTAPYAPQEERTPETTDQAKDILTEDDLAKLKVRVKVNGEEQELPVADVVKGFQKESAADRKLREAAAERKRLEEWEKELRQKEVQLKANPEPASERTDPDNTEDQLKDALAALVDGNVDQATQALAEILKKGNQPAPSAVAAVDESQIAARVKADLAQETEWDRFVGEFPEFAEKFDDNGNEVVTQERQYGDYLFDTKYAALVERGTFSYQQALRECATEVRKTFAPPPATPKDEPKKDLKEKRQEMKEAIDRIPVAAGAHSDATPEPDKDETPSSIIAEMRKARNLSP